MTKILHFLNGDSTKHIFDQTNISGDVAVIRETLCHGPLSSQMDHDFWNQRRQWFEENYFASPSAYNTSVFSELEKAKATYDEIIIWYEYDVFCQINMLGYLNWVLTNTDTKVSLIYSSVGIGLLSPEDYPGLFEQRIPVSDSLAQTCQSLWRTISLPELDHLEHLTRSKLSDLPNMSNALRAFKAQSLGDPKFRPIHLKIKDILKSSLTNGKDIVARLLNTDHLFGYGDLQYMIILTSMRDSLTFEPIIANNLEAYVEGVRTTTFLLKEE